MKFKNIKVPDQFPNLEGTGWNFQNGRVHNNILGHRQNLENSSMDAIDTQDTQREEEHTYTQRFLKTRTMLPKFVCRQNENVRVDEDSLTDKDVRVKRSDRGSRSLRGPMEVSVEERL